MMRRAMLLKVEQSLPADYQSILYIQAISGTFINSNYIPTVEPRIETRIEIMNSSDNDLFGFAVNRNPSYIVDASNYGNIFYNRFGDTAYTRIYTYRQITTPTNCEFGRSTIIGNSVLHVFNEVDWSTNDQVVYIGKGRNSNCDIRIYYCKLYDGSDLVRDFVPCVRIADNKPGMYDFVGRTFYTNQGSGEFVTP